MAFSPAYYNSFSCAGDSEGMCCAGPGLGGGGAAAWRARAAGRRHGGELSRGDVRRLLPLSVRARGGALLPPRAALPVRSGQYLRLQALQHAPTPPDAPSQ